MRRFDYQFVRFGLVGLVNTTVDIVLYIVLLSITGSILISNTISTGAALTLSLFLNKKFTFRVARLSLQQLVLFITVTLLGLWVLQPLIIFSAHSVLEGWFGLDEKSTLAILISKGAAIGFTTIWNYTLYKYFVFRKKDR